jgi:hypothetical protein
MSTSVYLLGNRLVHQAITTLHHGGKYIFTSLSRYVGSLIISVLFILK